METSQTYDVVVIGAGFSGLYQLHCLRDRLGLSVLVLEMAEDVGGTWYWNRYPGARCDSESHSYGYTFSDALFEEWDWSERYPGQPEILRYLDHVANRFDLRKDIRFGSRVTGARYDESQNKWHIDVQGKASVSATYLITAVGCLSSANVPDIPGLEEFEGDWYHTGQWPHEGVNFSGKRVGQIGTGSTGIQVAPVIAQTAEHLTVFQRTANYSVPARNEPLTPEMRQEIKASFDDMREMMRSNMNGHPFVPVDRKVLDVPEEERRAILEASWRRGGLRFRTCFKDVTIDVDANAVVADFIRNKIRDTVDDPVTATVLADIDHCFAAKRPPIDTHYFETFNNENVSLVDLRRDPITCVTQTGIRTGDEEHALDVIVFATGFDAMTGSLLRLNIEGVNGLPLAEAWDAGPRSYLGLQVHGFPNLFTITGPGSPSVLTNVPVAIEQHVEWITDCIAHMRTMGCDRIEAQPGAVDEWGQHVREAADATLLPTVKHSWYLGANIPGKPRVFMPYAGGMARYRAHCDAVAANGYEGFEISRHG